MKGDDEITQKTRASVGPRMKLMTENGEPIYGFLTAGHFTSIKGENIYYTKPNGKEVKIGEVYKRKFGGKVDASFVRVTDENCQISRYTKYVNEKGKTGQNYKMCATCCYGLELVVGQKIYKSGMETYLTTSTIASLNTSLKFSDVTLKNMIRTSSKFSEKGDSGANVFLSRHGSVYESIGIVSGATEDGTCSIITNMDSIDDAWKTDWGYPLYQY